MNTRKSAALTMERIRDGMIQEGQAYEFKRLVNLDDPRGKSNLIDDVVAFLNAGAGHLIVGVGEKRGVFERFQPLQGDKDVLRRRLTSIIQDSIDPKPMKVLVEFLDIDGENYIVDIVLPAHRLRPYQNKITGGFYLRTGAQNTPIPRDQVHSLFTSIEQFEADTAKLMERENAAVEARDIMQNNGATLHVAIVPQEHYERGRAPFDPGRGVLKSIRHYHNHSGSGVFKGCEDGVEVRDVTFDENRATSRFFIGDDWLIHSYVAHPITADASGRITIHEFHRALGRHLRDIQLLLDDSEIRGSFGVLLAMKNLKRNPKLAWGFPNTNSATMSRPARVERVDDPDLVERFLEKVRGVSVYGR
ncbi:MAG: ATP-binding protein [Mesorhizobium sp.]|uniref:AlbA family DNA-binding domain-containing protein n=2 Tax=unclassified Mesorhizobium TaxID=325217 RepID=UPI000FEA9F62|nr:ATP-binding protein [Mesorhizobium sp.]RWB94988.1 MAG: ATP-binding protein [Mesorhizobium sp.]